MGEYPPQKYIFYLEINYAEQNGYLKILTGCVWGNDGRGGLVALQSLSTIKKGTSHSNFQLNEPFSKFLRRLLRYALPGYGEKTKKKKQTTNCAQIVFYLGTVSALPMIKRFRILLSTLGPL